MNKKIEKILSLPKSLYVCLRLLPIKEVLHLPILVRYNVKLLSLKGEIIFTNGGSKMGQMQIGFGRVGVFDKKYSRSILEINGRIHLEGNGRYGFGHGCRICVLKDGNLYVGANFSNTAEMTIICSEEIHIGESVTTSWNTLIMDTDFHQVVNTTTEEHYRKQKPIYIDDDVWLCTRSVVLKGSHIPKGCIVGAGAVVNKSFEQNNSLIAGNPATVRKGSITMLRE